MADWLAIGAKEEVEEARQVQLSLGQRGTARRREDLKAHIGTEGGPEGLDHHVAPSGLGFYPTIFAPANVFDAPWPKVSLTQSQIDELVSQASADVRAVFGAPNSSAVSYLSFEYCSVSIERPWMDQDVFEFRSWRLPNDEIVASAADPVAGLFPTVVRSVVLARNISVAMSSTNATTSGSTAPGPGPVIEPRPVVVERPSPVKWELREVTRAVRPRSIDGGQPRWAVRRLGPEVADRTQLFEIKAAPTYAVRSPVPVALAEPGVVALEASLGARMMAVDFSRADFVRSALQIAPPQQPPPPQGEPEPVTVASTEVFVIGLICDRVGDCPNPDPNLQWDS